MGELIKVKYRALTKGFRISLSTGATYDSTSQRGVLLKDMYKTLAHLLGKFQKIVDEKSNLSLDKNFGCHKLKVFILERRLYAVWYQDHPSNIEFAMTKTLKGNCDCTIDKSTIGSAAVLREIASYRTGVDAWSETFETMDLPYGNHKMVPSAEPAERKAKPIWLEFSVAEEDMTYPSHAESYRLISALAAHVSLSGTQVTAKFEDFKSLSDAIAYLESKEIEFTVSTQG